MPSQTKGGNNLIIILVVVVVVVVVSYNMVIYKTAKNVKSE